MKYVCSCCGKEHETWPALCFSSPSYYDALSEEEKQNSAELSNNFCVLQNEDGNPDRFIRCTLTQKVIDHCEPLEYGLWVSLSEKSFQDYWNNFDNENHETSYFGWLSNNIPGYTFDKSIPTTVFTKKGNQRPEIVPREDYGHPFVHDYYKGITKAEADRRINEMLGTLKERET